MSLKRKAKRKGKKAARKAGRRVEKELSKALGNMPEGCHACHKRLDNKNLELLSSWQIKVWPDGTSELTCPRCQGN